MSCSSLKAVYSDTSMRTRLPEFSFVCPFLIAEDKIKRDLKDLKESSLLFALE